MTIGSKKKSNKNSQPKKNLAKSGYVHTFCLFFWGKTPKKLPLKKAPQLNEFAQTSKAFNLVHCIHSSDENKNWSRWSEKGVAVDTPPKFNMEPENEVPGSLEIPNLETIIFRGAAPEQWWERKMILSFWGPASF